MRVDRIDLVAGGQQATDQQPTVGLDPHRDLPWVLGMGGHHHVQLGHAGEPVRNPAGGQHRSVLVKQAQVMVGLAPVHANKQHRVLLWSTSAS
jgi:hypothetical protein